MAGDRTPRGGALGGRPPLTGVLITLAGVVGLAFLVLAIEPLRTGLFDAVRGDTGSLREEIRGLGVPGALIVLALALAHAFVWYPAEILDAAAGFVYGFWVAVALVMVGWVLNAIIAYWVGRHAARPLLYRFLRRERFLRYEGIVRRGGVTLLLAMRLIPVIPFSLFSYVAGAARVPTVTFVWTTAVGYLPLTAVFIYLGSRLEELSPTDPVLWIGAALLVGLLLLAKRVARIVAEPPAEASEPREAAKRPAEAGDADGEAQATAREPAEATQAAD